MLISFARSAPLRLRTVLVSALVLGGLGPQDADAKAQDDRAQSSRRWQEHRVKPGESLGVIATRYRVRVDHLQSWNGIKNPDVLEVGQVLRVFAPVPAPPRKHFGGSKSPTLPPAISPGLSGAGSAQHPRPSAQLAPKPRPVTPASEQEVEPKTPAAAKIPEPQAKSASLDKARLHTIPTLRPDASRGQSRLSFAPRQMLTHTFASPLETGSWWSRRKARVSSRRARRKERRRQRELAKLRSSFEVPAPALVNGVDEAQNLHKVPRRKRARSRRRNRAISIGSPNKGRLHKGVRLTSSNWYTVRSPEQAWGSTHALDLLHDALVRFRKTSSYDRELVVQAISRQSGGHFPPHRSHQSGRDVDIRLLVKPQVAKNGVPYEVSQVDWDATWEMVAQLLATQEVEYIFLNYDRQVHLYRAAKRAGVSNKDLVKWLQYPTRSKSQRAGVIRHSKGHRVHMHVRFSCAEYERDCTSI